MRIGKLSHKITIQSLQAGSPQQKPSGEPEEAWADYLTNIDAEWITLRGQDRFVAQEHHPETRGLWRIRWRSGITAKMRVVHNGLYYNILFVPPYDRGGKRWHMELECTQGVNDG
jgi:SPP1 family predicted phage head-tail adaptor